MNVVFKLVQTFQDLTFAILRSFAMRCIVVQYKVTIYLFFHFNDFLGYVRVKWDCGNVGRYRHGAQNAHDLTIVDEPRMLPDDVLIAEGVYVKRG